MKSARDRMTIIAAYQDAGTYRGAAAICGTTPKTVKRVIERAEAGDLPGRGRNVPATSRSSLTWWASG